MELRWPIVVATSNPHKVKEIREILAGLGLIGAGAEGTAILGLDETGVAGLAEPEETGSTFAANARIKATSYARQTGMMCLADDSGLEVDALGGAPGVISSHYCTDGREAGMTREDRDRANNHRLMRELAGVPKERRGARFVCVMALARPDGAVVHESRGTFEGRIGVEGEVPRGSGGFGYDPLLLVGPDFVRTSAELTAVEKNARSHRGAALREMARWITERASVR